MISRYRSEFAGIEVLEGLDDLGPGVHDEGPMGHHGLTDRLATEDEDVKAGMA